MRADLCGYDTSLTTQAAAESWDRMHLAFLAHGAATPAHLARVLELEPGFAMGHATKGLLYLMLGRRELVAVAEDALAQARAAMFAGSANPRERRYVAALDAWLSGRPSEAVAEMEAVLQDHPRDSLAAKISHAIRFILGDTTGMRNSIEAALPAFGHDHPARGYMMGCQAFALEETGAFTKAEEVGRNGLDLAPDDAWGLHAVAHVHDMTGQAKAGLAWLSGRDSAWAHCNNFRYHVWWHKALMHLDLGQFDEVFALYDSEVRKEKTDDYRDISNATSLLCRLELDGVAVGNRWEELAALSQERCDDGCLIFADLHYLLALVSDNRTEATKRLISRIRQDARTGSGEAAHRMAQPGVAAAAALEAFGEGNYTAAYLSFKTARPSLQMAGGSHAQRDVFERLTIDSALRAGFFEDAALLLADRKSRRGGHADGYWDARMSLIELQLGGPDFASSRTAV